MRDYIVYIGLGLAIVVGGLFCLLFLGFRTSSAPVTVTTTTSTPPTLPATSNGISYDLTPTSILQSDDGKYVVTAEVIRKDSWNWKSITIRDLAITPDGTVTLTSSLPTDPIPKQFQLTLETDAIESANDSHSINFTLEVKAKKHVNLSNATSSRSHRIPLNPAE